MVNFITANPGLTAALTFNAMTVCLAIWLLRQSQKERKDLLDRLMATDVFQYKAAVKAEKKEIRKKVIAFNPPSDEELWLREMQENAKKAEMGVKGDAAVIS